MGQNEALVQGFPGNATKFEDGGQESPTVPTGSQGGPQQARVSPIVPMPPPAFGDNDEDLGIRDIDAELEAAIEESRRNNQPLPAELMGTLSTSEDSETEGISESLTVLIARELEDEISKNKKKNATKQRNFQNKKPQVPKRKPKDPESNPQVPSPRRSPSRSPMKDKKGHETSKSNPASQEKEPKADKSTTGSPAKVQFKKRDTTTKVPRKQDDQANTELIDVEDISLEKEDMLGRRRFLRAIDKVIEANRSSKHEVARSPGSSSPRQ